MPLVTIIPNNISFGVKGEKKYTLLNADKSVCSLVGHSSEVVRISFEPVYHCVIEIRKH